MTDKKRLHFFAFYPDSFVGGTMFLSDEALGCYMRLLIAQWYQGGLPNDIDRIAPIAATARQHWPALADKFPVCEDGTRRNPRLEEERAKAAGRTERAKSGATKKWVNARAAAAAQAMLKQCESSAQAPFEHMQRASGSGSISSPPSTAQSKSSLHHGEKPKVIAEGHGGDGGGKTPTPRDFLIDCGVTVGTKSGSVALAMLERAESDRPGTVAACLARFGDVNGDGRWHLDAMYRKSKSRGLLMRELCAVCGGNADDLVSHESKIREQIKAIRKQGAIK